MYCKGAMRSARKGGRKKKKYILNRRLGNTQKATRTITTSSVVGKSSHTTCPLEGKKMYRIFSDTVPQRRWFACNRALMSLHFPVIPSETRKNMPKKADRPKFVHFRNKLFHPSEGYLNATHIGWMMKDASNRRIISRGNSFRGIGQASSHKI